MLADTLSKLIDFDLAEPNPPEKEGHEYSYASYDLLPGIHVGSSKHTPVLILSIMVMKKIKILKILLSTCHLVLRSWLIYKMMTHSVQPHLS